MNHGPQVGYLKVSCQIANSCNIVEVLRASTVKSVRAFSVSSATTEVPKLCVATHWCVA